jgi:DNA-binding CsgD family transcriptional regulator
MRVAIFAIITANLTLFLGLAVWAWRYRNRETYPRLRLMAAGLAVVSLAFVIGAATRLAGVGMQLGWFPGRLAEFALSEWHLLQSVSALALGIGGIIVIRKLAIPLKSAERLATLVSKQLLTGADLTELGLTARELQVVEMIAAGRVSDAEIAEALYIAPGTAGTHVKNALKKTGLRHRRELGLLFASLEM